MQSRQCKKMNNKYKSEKEKNNYDNLEKAKYFESLLTCTFPDIRTHIHTLIRLQIDVPT